MLGKRKKKNTLPAVCAVIVAAGSSRRMGGENKLLLPLAGTPVLAHTLCAFEKCAAIRDIVLVCREQDILPYTELALICVVSKLRTVTRGGDRRTASVLAGVQAATLSGPSAKRHSSQQSCLLHLLHAAASTVGLAVLSSLYILITGHLS